MPDNFEIAYSHCLFHLDSVHPHIIPELQFQHNGGRSWICRRRLPQPLNFEILNQPVTYSMLVLQVIGEISSVETVPVADREERDEVGIDGVHVACWVEPRPNTGSRTLWDRIQKSLANISGITGVKLDFSKLYAADETTGMLRLRVAWMPNELNVNTFKSTFDSSMNYSCYCFVLQRTTLPIFCKGYPCQLTDVLDRQPVQILFHLEHGPVTDNKAYLEASLIYIALV
jgi:hypothetical protein